MVKWLPDICFLLNMIGLESVKKKKNIDQT